MTIEKRKENVWCILLKNGYISPEECKLYTPSQSIIISRAQHLLFSSFNTAMVHHHFLLIIFPAQGQINPTLQFAKRLISMGARVTLLITLHIHRRMTNKITIPGLSLLPFSDGYDDGFNAMAHGDADFNIYISELRRRTCEFVTKLILSSAQDGHPFTCLAYTLLVPWAPELAREFTLPSVMLWVEPATVLVILYHYFHGYGDKITEQPLPGLPFSISPRDVPSFLLVTNSSVLSFVCPLFEEQMHALDLETNPTVLVNTFESLEPEALRAVDDKLKMIPIGPLIPSAFLDGKDPSDTSFGGDLLQPSSGYVEWLDSKSELTVVYVSFGSYFELSIKQREEIARALLDFGRPFLWVVREKDKVEELSCREELEEKGKIVNWCSQVEVLSHRALGCFLTHCGWNSTMESLVCGVPMVAFPQWSDQKTNAKLIEEVWKVGVRADCRVNGDGIVEREEIRRCLEVVMENGEKGNEMRRNVKKWKELSREAAKEGGPSEKNLRSFVDGVGECMRMATN